MGNIYKILGSREINRVPDHFPGRMVVELCENIHIHYRNLRLEFSLNEFVDFYRGMKGTFQELQKHFFDALPVEKLRLADIDPEDNGHMVNGDTFDCGEETQAHRDGIDAIKEILLAGGTVMPIAVASRGNGTYIRMDGFKRYWAHKELGRDEIKCYVLPEYVAGIQEGM